MYSIPIIPSIKNRRAKTNIKVNLESYKYDQDLISVLIGSLLGDAHGELRGNVRFIFKQSATHISYLLWLHPFFVSRGLCNLLTPEIKYLKGRVFFPKI